MSNLSSAKRGSIAGQRMPCTYIYLAAAGTVDEKVLALKSKANLARRWSRLPHGNNIHVKESMNIRNVFELADRLKTLRDEKKLEQCLKT